MSTRKPEQVPEHKPPHETGKPSTEPTPAGDAATLEELAEEEGGEVPPDDPDE